MGLFIMARSLDRIRGPRPLPSLCSKASAHVGILRSVSARTAEQHAMLLRWMTGSSDTLAGPTLNGRPGLHNANVPVFWG